MKLLVSIPENNLDFAKSAEAGGADAIKVHLNVIHTASGASFGSWKEERERIIAIIEAVKCEVFVMPGGQALPSEEDLAEMRKLGIGTLDIFAENIKPFMLSMKPKFDLFLALKNASELKLMDAYLSLLKDSSLKAVMVEASYVKEEDYGNRLTLADIAGYHSLAERSPIPILIPTQKLIDANDIPLLVHKNIGGIMIGVIVTGRSQRSIETVTRNFRKRIDAEGRI